LRVEVLVDLLDQMNVLMAP
jgi:hypothetical protein